MTILLIYDAIYPFSKGGGEKRLYELAKRLVGDGHKVIWLCSKSWDGDDTFMHDGIKVIGLFSGKESSSKPRRAIGNALEFSRLVYKYDLAGKNIDLIWAGQTPWVHIVAVYIKMFTSGVKIPVLVDCWEVWGSYWFEYYGFIIGGIGRLVEKLILSKADYVVGISGMTIDKINRHRKKNIFLAHNGIDTQSISSIEKSSMASDIIYFGRLVEHKNVDLIIEAAGLLVEQNPNLKVFILGGGNQLDLLKSLVAKYNLENNVMFFGFIDDYEKAISLMKSSKIFIQPSTSEGGGSIAVFEAQACGLPVIAIRHPQGIDEGLIIDGLNGEWIESKNKNELFSKITSMYYKWQSVEFDRHSCEQSVQQYDWNEITKVYKEILQKVEDARVHSSQ